MDTETIRLFVRASEKLNISAAGRDLGLAPAVASTWLAKLEKSVGADLFHRSTRKVVLSVEGEAFLPYAREILAQEAAARAAMGHSETQPNGTLRFTAPSTFSQHYIAPILPEFFALYPEITLDMRLSDSPYDLIEGSFDLALRNAPLVDSSLKGRKLANDTRILCASPNYLNDHGVPVTPADLAKHKLIAFRDQQVRKLKTDHGPVTDFNPRAASCQLILDDGLSLKRATIAGAGISLNSVWSVHDELRNGTLTHVLPDYYSADENVLWLIYPKSNILSPKVRVFMDFLIERIGKTPIWEVPIN